MFKGIYGTFCTSLSKPVIKMYSFCKTLSCPTCCEQVCLCICLKSPAPRRKKMQCECPCHVLSLRFGEENACEHVCTDAGYTCIPGSCLRSIGVGRGSHRSAQCMEDNLCHCTGDPSTLRHQCVKFKLLLQPGNSIIWGKDMSLWRILAVFLCKGREKERRNAGQG